LTPIFNILLSNLPFNKPSEEEKITQILSFLGKIILILLPEERFGLNFSRSNLKSHRCLSHKNSNLEIVLLNEEVI